MRNKYLGLRGWWLGQDLNTTVPDSGRVWESHLFSPRHAVGGHVKNTVHPLEGLVQGFFISDISLKQKEEVQVQGSDPRQALEDQPLPTPQSIGPYSFCSGSRAGLGFICTILPTPF